MIDILIIGAGAAGLTSAIYALRAGLKVVVLDKFIYGGQMAISDKIENYPGFKEITGYELAVKLYEQAIELGAEVIFDEVNKVDFSNEIKVVHCDQKTYESKAVIIAAGAKRRKLSCPGEEDFIGKGVSYCATCDGAFFKDKDVIVVGGGNTALEDALYLSSICKKVYLVHRRNTFKAERVLVDSAMKRENIEIIYDSTVTKIEGSSKVNSADVKNLINGNIKKFPIDAVFVSIGNQPDTSFVRDIIKTDDRGYIEAAEDCICSVKGVFAAGDCRKKPLYQIVTATADGAVAAFQAINYIQNLED